jgi:hypothetical protein
MQHDTLPGASERPTDLSPEDIEAIRLTCCSLPGEWKTRVCKIERALPSGRERWVYVFWGGASDDVSTVITVTRTTAGYTVADWDLVSFWTTGAFPAWRYENIVGATERLCEIANGALYEPETVPVRRLGNRR